MGKRVCVCVCVYVCVCVCVWVGVVCGTFKKKFQSIFFQGGQVDFPSTPTTLKSTHFDQIVSAAGKILEEKGSKMPF